MTKQTEDRETWTIKYKWSGKVRVHAVLYSSKVAAETLAEVRNAQRHIHFWLVLG